MLAFRRVLSADPLRRLAARAPAAQNAVRAASSRSSAASSATTVSTTSRVPLLLRRFISSSAPQANVAASAEGTSASKVETYTRGMQALHWLVGTGMVTCVATVKMAQWTDDKKKKGTYMMVHKSTALLVAALVLPRLAVRLSSKLPGAVPGTSKVERTGASLSHLALYVGIIGMPATGIAMGYFGGKGLPFFGMHIPGAATPDKSIAKTSFKVHKKMGQVLEYLIPLHIAGTLYHMAQGVSMFTRMGFGLSSANTATASAAIALVAASNQDTCVDAVELRDHIIMDDDDDEEEEEEEAERAPAREQQ